MPVPNKDYIIFYMNCQAFLKILQFFAVKIIISRIYLEITANLRYNTLKL